MTHANFVAALNAFTSRRRFQPIVVELRTGVRLIVRHPEALTMRGQVAYYVRRNSSVRLFDASSVNQLCDLPFEEEPSPIEPVSD